MAFLAGAGAAAFLLFIAFIAFLGGAGAAPFLAFMAFIARAGAAGASGPRAAASNACTATSWQIFGMVMIRKGGDSRDV